MNWFINLKIRSKLLIGFFCLVLITAVTGYLAVSSIGTAKDNEGQLYQKNLMPISKMVTITDNLQRIRVNTLLMVLNGSEQESADIRQKMENYQSSIESFIEYYPSIILSDRERQIYNNFVENYRKYNEGSQTVFSLMKNGKTQDAINYVNLNLRSVAVRAQDDLSQLVKINDEQAQQAYQANESNSSSAVWEISGIIIAGIIISIFLALFISRWISKGIAQVYDRIDSLRNICITNLQNGAEKMSRGDLNVKIETGTKPLNIQSEDEIGTLAKRVNDIIKMIQGTVVSVETAVSKVNGLIKESKKMVKASLEGNLSERAEDDQFEGGYKEVIVGLNNTLDAVSKPFSEARSVLEKMAKGDLTVRMEGEYRGEYRTLKESLNKTASSLNNTLMNVTRTIEATASAAAQISSSTEEIASGAQEQSSQTNEIASSVEQMTKTILETSRNANTASESAKNAGAVAKEGGAAVFNTIDGMNKIDDIVSNASATVLKLGESSSQIGEIIQVIDDIADQTNLLALNAAIEAARAGEQGRGFAVVADEVRKLAERTTKATKEIELMIKQIQKDTDTAVSSIGRGTEEVKKGKSLADKAGSSLEQIITGAGQVLDIINQVAAASEEQSTAAEQISKNIEMISTVTSQSASGVQEIAKATEDLNRLTLNLQELISKFELGEAQKGFSVRQNGKLVTSN